ncbi:MAG: anaerobic ribonucleoside-triphosphate reductase activating protein [Bacteroidales bacterium]|nr:anaerobic ribonucleoside-triphosphate reductase activating protein [Candidatus Physcousia equi]
MDLRIIEIIEDTTVDGPGFRTSIYCSGCAHACPGCHNPQSWDINAGTKRSVEEILRTILDDPFADVTFTGGDPIYQVEGFTELAKAIKTNSDKTIWCYTGFLYESLVRQPQTRLLLQYIDVLVDGPYKQDLRDEDLLYRGSSNQRLIDVKASLEQHKVILWKSPMALVG